jgi:hypothetical protein
MSFPSSRRFANRRARRETTVALETNAAARDDGAVPHYWFSISLETAPHLKRAKDEGGGPGVKKALRRDARERGKGVSEVYFTPGLDACAAVLFSDDDLTSEECAYFKDLWEAESTCQPRLTADETVLEPDSGWTRQSATGPASS